MSRKGQHGDSAEAPGISVVEADVRAWAADELAWSRPHACTQAYTGASETGKTWDL